MSFNTLYVSSFVNFQPHIDIWQTTVLKHQTLTLENNFVSLALFILTSKSNILTLLLPYFAFKENIIALWPVYERLHKQE